MCYLLDLILLYIMAESNCDDLRQEFDAFKQEIYAFKQETSTKFDALEGIAVKPFISQSKHFSSGKKSVKVKARLENGNTNFFLLQNKVRKKN